jgi:hypothetical protein
LLSNEIILQIQGMENKKNKYGNLLSSLSSTIGEKNHYREEINKLKPICKI